MRQPLFKPRLLITPTPHPAEAVAASHKPIDKPPEKWSSDRLLAGRNEIAITHGDSVYRLRLTSLGKLILTK